MWSLQHSSFDSMLWRFGNSSLLNLLNTLESDELFVSARTCSWLYTSFSAEWTFWAILILRFLPLVVVVVNA